jgi:hypothetical protein
LSSAADGRDGDISVNSARRAPVGHRSGWTAARRRTSLVSGGASRAEQAMTEQQGKRLDVLRSALLAALTAEVSTCERVFTSDVAYSSPVLTASSLDDLETQLSSRADALRDVEVTLDSGLGQDDVVVAEWQVAADHVQAWVVSEDTELTPGGERITLQGASVARFRGARICSIRHYFDPSALLGRPPAG